MSKDITCLAIPPDLQGPWAYKRRGEPVVWAKTHAEKQALSDLNNVVVVLAGENIRRFHLDLDGLRGRELRSAAEFELEDHMGGSISDEIICHDRKASGKVAVISSALQMQLGETLSAYNLNPVQILIDYDLLSNDRAIEIGERLLKGGPDGFAVHREWQSLLIDAPTFEALTPDALFEAFEAGIENGAALDLRPGLGLKNTQTAQWQKWAKIAALAAGVIILPFMLDYYAEARALNQQAAEDRRAASELYTQVTGETSADAARSISQKLKAGQSSAGFLDMTASLFPAIEDVGGVEIDSLRYDPRQNMLQLTLRYPSFEAGAALEQAVQQRGGQLVVGGIRERADALIGEASLTLSQGGKS